MADPGFPVGGREPIGGGHGPPMQALLTKMYAKMNEFGPIGGVDPLGGVDLLCRHFSPKMYVKLKELGLVGGACTGHFLP